MHLGIIGSGYDVFMTLGLMNHTNHVFSCIVDSAYGTRGQKSWELTYERVQASIDYAISLGVEKIILPPVFEIIYKDKPKVLPLYQNYLLSHVFPKSRVGKLGILADRKDTQIIQKELEKIASTYTLTDFQSSTKKFKSPFSRWTKDVSIWSDFLRRAKPSDWMLRKYIKNDLRYFQDADVDSLIPTSYTHFYREGVLRHHLNFKKIRRQEKKYIQQSISELVGEGKGYGCQVYANDDIARIVQSYPWNGYIGKGEEMKGVVYGEW